MDGSPITRYRARTCDPQRRVPVTAALYGICTRHTFSLDGLGDKQVHHQSYTPEVIAVAMLAGVRRSSL